MTYNENSKKAIDKWRLKNKEKYNSYMLTKVKEYRINNNEHSNRLRMLRYYYHKEAAIFRNILIEQ